MDYLEPGVFGEVWDALGFFRALLEMTDSSLIEEWESLLHPEARLKVRQDFITAGRPAGDGVTDMNHVPSHRPAVDHLVEGGQFLDLQR